MTLTLPYDPALDAANHVASLTVNYWNKETGKWEELPSEVDVVNKTVKAKTTHFSLYQVFAAAQQSVADTSGADRTFALRDVYAFPNPAVGGVSPVVHVAVGIADKVTIRFFNIAGQQVHEVVLDAPPVVINDGSGPKYAYEYAWTAHIPSGVYLYTIVAEKSGSAAIRKAGKFSVIR